MTFPTPSLVWIAELLAQQPAAPGGGPAGDMTVTGTGAPRADFQPYIFWAYGGVCLLLFAFTLWTTLQSRQVAGRLTYLKGRFAEAHPGEARESLDA